MFKFCAENMEQLAHFVTKSFEYNNNRVLEVINMSTKSILYENNMKSFESDKQSSYGDGEQDDDTLDINITDIPDEPNSKEDSVIESSSPISLDTNDTTKITDNPLSLIKKPSRDVKYITKNWLISDSPKRKGKTFCALYDRQAIRDEISDEDVTADENLIMESAESKIVNKIKAKPVTDLLNDVKGSLEKTSKLAEDFSLNLSDNKRIKLNIKELCLKSGEQMKYKTIGLNSI